MSPDKFGTQSNTWDDGRDNEEPFDVEKILAIVRRQWRVVAVSIVVFLAVGVAYVITAVPLYTATASLLIDKGNSGLVNQLSVGEINPDDEASILSQVEVLKSDTIASAVVDKLGLANDPVFTASPGSMLSSLKSAISSTLNISKWLVDEKLDGDLSVKTRQIALARVQDGMGISRVGRSYVLNVDFTSVSPQLSAKIANGIAEAYIIDKLDSKYDATRRASDWLQARIEELRQKALETDLAVQRFRADNGLLATGGQLITDQQLSELNSALIVAQAETAKANAKYERIKQIIASGQSDAIVTDVLDSSISNELRKKYLEASKLEAEISNRLGPNHIRAIQLRDEMKEFQRLMFEELNRIAESYKSEYDVAQSRERALGLNVSAAKGASAVAGETGVQLRELERAAETYKNLYQTFLQRYQEAIQQQSFPITEARVISRPAEPEKPSYPRKMLVFALFGMLGAAVGAAAGGFREFRDRFFRTGDQVRDSLQIEFLGMTPMFKSKPLKKTAADQEASVRRLWHNSSVTKYVVDHPMSAFAETLRNSKIAIDLQRPDQVGKVVGIVSTLPGEGKSTISINLAELLAMQGSKTLLIDCDMRNPGATRAIARHADAGLLEVLTEGRQMMDLLLMNDQTRLAFLPAVVRRRIPHSSELLASPAMQQLLEFARAHFDYVILDLPPLAPVVDSRAVSGRVDDFIYVIEWGKTSRKVVKSALGSNPEVAAKTAGVILNKVDTEKMKLYRSYGSSDYYYASYRSYYREG